MKIAIGSDHGGVNLKKDVIKHLQEKGIEVKDFGTYTEESCDYPEYGQKVAEEVVAKNYDFGIVICGTGIGISISANKVPGARAALCHDTFSAHATREHNNANILALGARVTGPGLALDIVDAFLGAKFEGGRHERRIDKITEIEKKYEK
ncbi:ribose 5-phosphate isomerase B [Clostridium botulinum]|uniref:Ribose 5-phosphate isomerase n=1 Tax=Clostridium botulinum C/D str. DC5 TaxID=1443128 RepID=A0A0A0IGL8_CLOBO|nr:ribose 5-phosphate isomerase B [Clostridium botulinum]KEI00314.1 ribose 5-phosphate isomerase [Clostridium botulinum C/D str. BKT75002]KEI08935.1 ribose 5-phosphate isomerase [Clostridium botulinum C/D str. BKT2873]KGM93847.1 ribose 5-phosphate isomerase [Clostridium botulinum D str. CCUG 7971]KGM99406.1 ribose 5-phosphate isomerase [Clostridium botulinum C/D str. DC5]KOC51188.1 ribose 5-phosphate isomerase [Clostridium botulinum]